MEKLNNNQDKSIFESASSYLSGIGANLFGKTEVKDIIEDEILKIEKIPADDSLFCKLKANLFSKEISIETPFEQTTIVEIEEINDLPEDIIILPVEITAAQKSSFLEAITKSTAKSCDEMKNGLASSWDYGLVKATDFKNSSIETAQTASVSLLSLSNDVGKKYKQIEIIPKVTKLINVIDLAFVIASLEALNGKYRRGSKEALAFSVLIVMLGLLETAKKTAIEDAEVAFAPIGLNESIPDLFKTVNFKSVIETAEPFLLLIPNGNYILLILRLFI